jgi:hypothetical protein
MADGRMLHRADRHHHSHRLPRPPSTAATSTPTAVRPLGTGMRFRNVSVRPLGGGFGCLMMILVSILLSVLLTVALNLLAH